MILLLRLNIESYRNWNVNGLSITKLCIIYSYNIKFLCFSNGGHCSNNQLLPLFPLTLSFSLTCSHKHTHTQLLSASASMSHSSSINIQTDKALANHSHCTAYWLALMGWGILCVCVRGWVRACWFVTSTNHSRKKKYFFYLKKKGLKNTQISSSNAILIITNDKESFKWSISIKYVKLQKHRSINTIPIPSV